MAIDTIKSSAVLDGAIATADIADDAVTSAKIDSTSTGMTLADLTVDTSTLKVDATNNRVGVGLTAPQELLHIKDGSIVVGNGTASNNARVGKIGFSTDSSNSRFIGIESFRLGDAANADLRFHTFGGDSDSGERMRIHTNGVVSCADGIALGAGTANTTANVIDDYEEGTWTPVITPETQSAASITVNIAQYTKVGRLVSLVFQVTINSISGTNNARAIELTGMPFTVNSGSTAGGPNIGYTNLNSMTGSFALQGFSTTLYRIVNLNGTTGLNASDHLKAGSILRGQFTYHTDQ